MLKREQSLLLMITLVSVAAGTVRAERIYTHRLSVGEGPDHDYSTINDAIVAMSQMDPALGPDTFGCIEVYEGTYREQLNDAHGGNDLPAYCDLTGMEPGVVIEHARPGQVIAEAAVDCLGNNIVSNLRIENYQYGSANVQTNVRFRGDGELTDCTLLTYHGPAVTGQGHLVVSRCKVLRCYYGPCILARETFLISDCELYPSCAGCNSQFPTGIRALGSGRIRDVKIRSTGFKGSYNIAGSGLFGITLELEQDEQVLISGAQITLQLTSKYNPNEREPLRVCGILSGQARVDWLNSDYPGSAVVEDCTIDVNGVEDGSDPVGDGAGIMVDGICVRGGGTVQVCGDTSITTGRIAAGNALDGYEYLLNNENGTLAVDVNTVVFHPPEAETNGVIDQVSGYSRANIVVECEKISPDLHLEYSLTASSGPWLDVPMMEQVPYVLLVPAGSELWFQASVGSTDYEYCEWRLYENAALLGGNPDNAWSFAFGADTLEVDLNVRYKHTRRPYTISGTILRCDGTTVPGGVNLKVRSDQQVLSQTITNGSFSFTLLPGTAWVTITPSADRYCFSPERLVYSDLNDNHLGEAFVGHIFDDKVPTLSFQNVPPAVGEDSSVSFAWIGEDDLANPANLRYQYKLDGADSDWSPWVSETSKSYELPNGAYTFRVRVDEVGNANQVPGSYDFVVNAAPRVTAFVRTNDSVWASKVTLQMPAEANLPGNVFVLLPEHSGISDPELVPVRISHADDANACGANAIVADKLDLPTLIEKTGGGWAVTLPENMALGQVAEYDISWGKTVYFGWQEEVPVPLDFPNGNSAQSVSSYLDDELRLWRMLTKKTVPSLYPDSWVLMSISDRYGPVVGETVLRYARGHPFDGSEGSYTQFPYNSIHKVGENMFCLWFDQRYEWDGQADRYDSRYGLECFDPAGVSLSTLDGTYDEGLSSSLMYAIADRIWFVGLTDRQTLWFEARDWEGQLAVPRTTFESFDSENSTAVELSHASAVGLGDNVSLLWTRFWYTSTGRYRKQICYQVRDADGRLVRDTTVLTPLLDDEIERDDCYWFHSLFTDKQGRVWVAYQHSQSEQPTKYAHVVLNPGGGIWKGPTQTTAARYFEFCDREGYIWAAENDRVLVLNPNQTTGAVPRESVWIPNQDVGNIAAFVSSDGYRLYDRWSAQAIEVDVPAGLNQDWIEIFDLDLWDNDLHPANLILKKGDISLWAHSGQFNYQTTVNIAGRLNEGVNLLLIEQDNFMGGQVLVTFPPAVPQMIAVPNVLGLARAAAESAICSAGLTIGTVAPVYSSVVPVGHVISQEPLDGVPVVVGSAVDLAISDGSFRGYFAEQFSSDGDTFDMSKRSLIFNPNEDGTSYGGYQQAITELPTDPIGGAELALSDDSYLLVTLNDQKRVSMFGVTYSSFYVSSNGYITFIEGDDCRYESFPHHFGTRRISALFDDLDPSSGGVVSFKQLADRVAVTWQNVPEFGMYNSNTFQVEMFFDGNICLSWLEIAAEDGIVGLSTGHGVPTDFEQTNLSQYPQRGTQPLTISGYVWTSGGYGLSRVSLSFSGGGGTTTDSSGYYSMKVPYGGWSGAVTPAKSGYTFSPAFWSYSNITSDISCQDYAALAQETSGYPDYPGYPGYFTEQFSSDGDTFDLSYKSIKFTPSGDSDLYSACLQAITQLPTDPAEGVELALGDDGYELVTLNNQKKVSIFGVTYSSFYVSSNGYITFTEGDDCRSESFPHHFGTRRISALFDDLDPSSGGAVSFKQLADRVAVTWQNVPEFGAHNTNTFQVEMYFDGDICLSWLEIEAQDGIVGLSNGHGVPADFEQADLSQYPQCGTEPPVTRHVPVVIVVDLNRDGKVDLRDYCKLAQYWFEDRSSLDIASQPFEDGAVDIEDLAVFTEYWLKDFRLLAHWKLDETNAPIALDSASQNQGTLHGDPLWQPAHGRVGGALRFDGTDDYVSTEFTLNPAGREFGVLAWVKTSCAGRVVIAQKSGDGLGRSWLCTDGSEGKLMTELRACDSFGGPLISQRVITDGQWHHIGLVWDGLCRYLFVDGVEVARDSRLVAGLESADGDIIIGAANSLSPGTFWFGLIDDIRVYNRALSAGEVQSLAP